MLLASFISINVFICLDELQKPWIVKKTVVNPGSASSSSSVETTSKTAQDDVLVEKEKSLAKKSLFTKSV